MSAEEVAERAKRIIEIEVYQPAEDLLAESNDEDATAAASAAAAAAAAAASTPSGPVSKAAKYSKAAVAAAASGSSKASGVGIDTSIFRYMYQNEDELREALETNMMECQSIMSDKDEFTKMRTVAKSDTNTLAKALVGMKPAAAAPPATVVVKTEPQEEKKGASEVTTQEEKKDESMTEEGTQPSSTASPATQASSPAASASAADSASTPAASAASATPAASAASSSSSSSSAAAAAAAAAAPINVDDEDDEASSNQVPLVSIAQSKAQHSVLLCGRIVYDSNDSHSEGVSNEAVQKLAGSTHSVWMEGDKALSGGQRIQMRLNGLKSYGLFPGQVVLAKGINASGLSFVAEEIFSDASLPHSSMARAKVQSLNGSLGDRPLGLMVAAGPFTTSEDLSFAPLFELLKEVVRVKPDVLLLIGPFLDAEHRELSGNFSGLTATYSKLFTGLLEDVMSHVRGLPGIKVLVVPSVRDLSAIPIFPQPALEFSGSSELAREQSRGRLSMLPNPACFRLNDMTVGVSSMDIISHLGASNEISKAPPAAPIVLGAPAPKDAPQGRLQRLASHLIASHSFYPLFPAPDGVHLDYSHVANLKMHSTPDLLILPSKTRYFASPVTVAPPATTVSIASGAASGAASSSSAAASSSSMLDDGSDAAAPPSPPTTIVVNPEFLTKGPSGGTYGLVSIHPLKVRSHALTRAGTGVVPRLVTPASAHDHPRSPRIMFLACSSCVSQDDEMVPPPNSRDRLTDHCMMSRTRVDIIRI